MINIAGMTVYRQTRHLKFLKHSTISGVMKCLLFSLSYQSLVSFSEIYIQSFIHFDYGLFVRLCLCIMYLIIQTKKI